MSSLNLNPRSSNLIDYTEARGIETPDAIAYTFLDSNLNPQNVSYSELFTRARIIALRLKACGAHKKRALLLFPPGLRFVEAFYGCMLGGTVAVPAYPPKLNRLDRTLPRLLGIVADCQPKAVLTTGMIKRSAEALFEQSPELAQIEWIAVDELEQDGAKEWVRPDIRNGNLAFLQYTSGSTAAPKGVMVTHENINHNTGVIRQVMDLSPDTRVMAWLPLFHDMGLIGFILQPMRTGHQSFLMSPFTFLQKPYRWLKACSDHQIFCSGGPNFAFELCRRKVSEEQMETLDLSHLRVLFCGAEPISYDTLRGFSDRFKACGLKSSAMFPCYGLAESTLLSSGAVAHEGMVSMSVAPSQLKQGRAVPANEEEDSQLLVSSGMIPSGLKVVIIDPEKGTRASPETIGEICVFGKSVAKGYWNKTEETEDGFQFHLSDTGEGPFLRTGDLGYLRDSQLYVTGRSKDLIILRGANYFPQDIEETVETADPGVRPGSVAAFTVMTPNSEALVILAEYDARKGNDPVAALDVIRRQISGEHSINASVVALIKPRTIWKTSSGKIQRSKNKAAFEANELELVQEWRLPELKIVANSSEISNPAQATSSKTSEKREKDDAPPPRRKSGKYSAQEIEKFIKDRIAEEIHVSPGEINTQIPLGELGLDSVAEVSLSGELEEWLGDELHPTLTWSYPSVDKLSRYLAGEAVEPVEREKK